MTCPNPSCDLEPELVYATEFFNQYYCQCGYELQVPHGTPKFKPLTEKKPKPKKKNELVSKKP